MPELVWGGKYGADGSKTRPVRVALPFQDVETVNESAQERDLMLDLFARNEPGEWRNRLIWGDKKYVLPSLLPEFAGKVDLIYIDPPFATGADFSYTARIPDDPTTEGDQSAEFVKQPSIIEQKAYRDTWGRGLDSYLQWFYETVVLLHGLLAETGSLYVHLDWRVGHYAKTVIDEVFGRDRFLNEIVWFYPDSPGRPYDKFPPKHDVIFRYAKSEKFTFNGDAVRVPILEASKKRYEKPRYLINSQGKRFEYVGGKAAEVGKIPETVWQIPVVKGTTVEARGYATQKPEVLLERIIGASSNEKDLVLDCFAGSGTTAAVAEKLGRRWITADLGRFAVHTTRKRLLSNSNVRPFVVQNLGKYERQAWQTAEFGESGQTAALAQARYRRFILNLYGAEPIEGNAWLHGVRAGHFVHVGSVDAPVLAGDVKAIAREFWRAAGQDAGASTNAVDVLGWDFGFELNELSKEMAADANIELSFRRIPRDVMDKRVVEQGDTTFFQLPALDVELAAKPGLAVRAELCDFMVPPEDIPQDVQSSLTHWSQYIDYWSVDWDHRDDTFHNQWQSYRTKKNPKLKLAADHTYEAPGFYDVVVKVIDILGNDTTKSMTVEVG